MKKKSIIFMALVLGIGAMFSPVIGHAKSTQASLELMDDILAQPMGFFIRQYTASIMTQNVTDLLNISLDELYDLRTSGISIKEIAYSSGYSTDEFVKLLIKKNETKLDQLVRDKIITRDQKEMIMAYMDAEIRAAIIEKGADVDNKILSHERLNPGEDF